MADLFVDDPDTRRNSSSRPRISAISRCPPNPYFSSSCHVAAARFRQGPPPSQLPYFARVYPFRVNREFTPTRIGMPSFPLHVLRYLSARLSSEPMLPGLILILSAPAPDRLRARACSRNVISATRGILRSAPDLGYCVWPPPSSGHRQPHYLAAGIREPHLSDLTVASTSACRRVRHRLYRAPDCARADPDTAAEYTLFHAAPSL